MIIFDVDDLKLNRLSFGLKCFHTLHVYYLWLSCYLVFGFYSYGAYAIGGGLEGRNHDKTKYDTILNTCKTPPSLEEAGNPSAESSLSSYRYYI